MWADIRSADEGEVGDASSTGANFRVEYFIGCGALQAREVVESIREAPELDTDSRTYRDIKVFTNFFEWESYNNSIEIPVDSSVTDISIYKCSNYEF